MNYILILQDAFRIFRTTKLIWGLGFISLLTTLFQFLPSGRDNPLLFCISLPIGLAVWYFSVIASGGLTYLIHQTALNRRLTFTEVWHQSRARVSRLVGVSLLIIPIGLIAIFIFTVFALKAPTSPILWFIVLFNLVLFSSLLTFGNCAIMINDVSAVAAAWTSFLITLNNFFRVIVITGTIFFIRLLGISLVVVLFSSLFKLELPIPLAFDYSTYQKIMAMPIVVVTGWVIDLPLTPLTSIIMTLSYLKFTKEISYPALSKQQSAA